MTHFSYEIEVSAQGEIGFYVCDLCGQPLPRDAECNSSIHVGPGGRGAKGRPVLTNDLAIENRRLKRECPFDTNDDGDCGQHGCPYCGDRVSERIAIDPRDLQIQTTRQGVTETPGSKVHVKIKHLPTGLAGEGLATSELRAREEAMGHLRRMYANRERNMRR